MYGLRRCVCFVLFEWGPLNSVIKQYPWNPLGIGWSLVCGITFIGAYYLFQDRKEPKHGMIKNQQKETDI